MEEKIRSTSQIPGSGVKQAAWFVSKLLTTGPNLPIGPARQVQIYEEKMLGLGKDIEVRQCTVLNG